MEYSFFAFISYSSKDIEWGKRLQRKLEGYKMSSTICSEHGWSRTPMKPVFFAPTDIQPGDLTEELKSRLRASRYLIVIGSPHSAASGWVAKEIEYFHSLGRTGNIHYFIIGGQPNSGDPATECYNYIIKELGIPEILGVNVNEKIYRWPWLNKERAYVQLVTKLLGVEFDTIWQRHKRLLAFKVAVRAVLALVVSVLLLVTWSVNQPRDVEVRVAEEFLNGALPAATEVIVTMEIDGEKYTDTIPALPAPAEFRNIPAKFFGKEVRLKTRCRDFVDTDTLLGLDENLALRILRDPSVYGKVHFFVKDVYGEEAIPGVEVEIAGVRAVSAADGLVEFDIPLERQQCRYCISSSVPLSSDSLHMPCSENTQIRLKE